MDAIPLHAAPHDAAVEPAIYDVVAPESVTLLFGVPDLVQAIWCG